MKEKEINNEKNNILNKMNNLMDTLENNKSKFSDNEKIMFEILKTFQENSKEFIERVELLEKHQLLLYHQVSLYQNSRDNGKSIFFYLHQYFNLEEKEAFFFK